MTLEQKRIPYRVEKINMRCYGEKPASFTRMQPSGNIPVYIIDGVTYNQSNDIMYALEQTRRSQSIWHYILGFKFHLTLQHTF